MVHGCKIPAKLIRLLALNHSKRVTLAVFGPQREVTYDRGLDGINLGLPPLAPGPAGPGRVELAKPSQGHLIPSLHPITALSPGQMRSMHGGHGDLADWQRYDNQQQGARRLTPLCPMKGTEHVLVAKFASISPMVPAGT